MLNYKMQVLEQWVTLLFIVYVVAVPLTRTGLYCARVCTNTQEDMSMHRGDPVPMKWEHSSHLPCPMLSSHTAESPLWEHHGVTAPGS